LRNNTTYFNIIIIKKCNILIKGKKEKKNNGPCVNMLRMSNFINSIIIFFFYMFIIYDEQNFAKFIFI
jgi:hypothetical protein